MSIISININKSCSELCIVSQSSFVFLCHHRALQEMGFGDLQGFLGKKWLSSCMLPRSVHDCGQKLRLSSATVDFDQTIKLDQTCIPFLNYKTVFLIWSCAQLHRSISTSHVSNGVERSNKANKPLNNANLVQPLNPPRNSQGNPPSHHRHPVRALLRSSRFSTSLDTRASSRVIKPVSKDDKGRVSGAV